MRWIYREFFYVPKYAKVPEKVMNAHVVLTVAVIVVSLVAMSLSAYAYFSCGISSGSSQIQAASFGAAVSITTSGGQSIDVTELANGTKQATLPAGTHQISIQAEGTAATGFCIIELQDCDTVYHTQQLEPVSTMRSGFSFSITVSKETVALITPNWGTSSYFADYDETKVNTEPYILNSDTVSPVLNQPQQDPPTQTTEPPATEAPTTEPPTEAPTTEPSTEAPTEAPTTEPPTEAPTTEPSTEAPTEAPTTEPPTEAPTEAPTTEPPATEAPTTEPQN